MGYSDQCLFKDAVNFFKKFDLIGNLIAILLSGDFACAGKFDMPSTSEMGALVKNISAGAVCCMQLQGTVRDKGNKERCQVAFAGLYCYLEKELTIEENKKIKFSTIILEHATCKYYKTVTYYQY